MSDAVIFQLYMWFLMALSGVFAYRSFVVIKAKIEYERRRKTLSALKQPRDEDLCKGPHSWEKSMLAFAEIDTGMYLVCKECGNIANTDYSLNGPAKEILLNNLKLREEKVAKNKALNEKRIKLIDGLMNRMVKDNIESFDGDFTKNSYALQQFYRKTVLGVECIYAELAKEDSDG